MERPAHIIVVGDPGTGKITLLNALHGRNAPFESGLSIVGGLTTALHTFEVGGVRYSDTPGLDDCIRKTAAAAAIEAAIRHGGAVRLLFVLTMEAGPVRGSNLATIRIVLNALSAAGIPVGGRYSVVLNKMSAGELTAWKANPVGATTLLRQLLGLASEVDQIGMLPSVDGLCDATNGRLPAASVARVNKMVKRMEHISVPRGTKVTVPVNELEALTRQFERKLWDQEQKRDEAGRKGMMWGAALMAVAWIIIL